jgi:hypothetical protein
LTGGGVVPPPRAASIIPVAELLAFRAQGIDLVDEQQRRRVGDGVLKQ